MKKRMLILITIALALTMIISACTPKRTTIVVEPTEEEEQVENNEPVVIGLSIQSLAWPYMAAYVQNFEALVAEKEKVTLITLSADASIEKQTNDINDLIVQNVDIILVAALDAQAVVPAIKAAYDAGIPVLAVTAKASEDAVPYLVGYSGPDDYTQGRIAAEIMIEAVGTEGSVVMIEGTAGQSTTQLRADGFNDVLAEQAPDLKIIASQPCDWDPVKEKAAMQTWLNQYGDEIDGVFAQGGGTSVGEVIKEAGYSIPVVCTGLRETTYTSILNGIVYGSMSQSPKVDADQALKLALRIVNGEELDEFTNIIPMPAVTAANIDEFEPEY